MTPSEAKALEKKIASEVERVKAKRPDDFIDGILMNSQLWEKVQGCPGVWAFDPVMDDGCVGMFPADISTGVFIDDTLADNQFVVVLK